jgi:signal transduction histidine kinase
MSIVDDGRGFATEKVHEDLGSPHWGLVTMRERAEAIGGRCTIESSPGHGTRVEVEIPTAA